MFSKHIPQGARPIVKPWPEDQISLTGDGFSIYYSKQSLCPVISWHSICRETIERAANIGRRRDFSPDMRLTGEARRADSEYTNDQGLDQGHLVPAADMPSNEAMAQSFLLTNCMPQARDLNRGEWKKLESASRLQAINSSGTIYVAAGTLHRRWLPSRKLNSIWIPYALWRAVFDPATGQAVCHYVKNKDDALPVQIGYDQLCKITGHDPFCDAHGLRRLPWFA